MRPGECLGRGLEIRGGALSFIPVFALSDVGNLNFSQKTCITNQPDRLNRQVLRDQGRADLFIATVIYDDLTRLRCPDVPRPRC